MNIYLIGGAVVLLGIVGAGVYRAYTGNEVVKCDNCGTEIIDPDETAMCTVCDTPLFDEAHAHQHHGQPDDTSSNGDDTQSSDTETEHIDL